MLYITILELYNVARKRGKPREEAKTMKNNAKTFFSRDRAEAFASQHKGAEIWSGLDAFKQRIYTVRW